MSTFGSTPKNTAKTIKKETVEKKAVRGLPLAIDRRPMWSANVYGGITDSDVYPDENRFGCHPNWRGPEGPEWFVEHHLRKAQRNGCDRIFVNRPAGGPSNGPVSFASWHSIPAYKREAILEKVTDYIMDEAPRNLDLCYYIGCYVADLRTVMTESDKNPERYTMNDWKFDSSDEYSRMVIRSSIGGLMAGGATSIGLDAASTWDYQGIDLAHELANPPFKLRTIGEAIPVLRNDNGSAIKDDKKYSIPDMDKISQMPYLGLLRYFRRFDPKWTVDINKTEVYVWLNAQGWNHENDDVKERTMIDYMNRGFIPIVWEEKWIEMAIQYGAELKWYK